MDLDIFALLIMLLGILPDIAPQSNQATTAPQSNQATTAPQSNQATTAPQSNPATTAPQSNPATTAPQSNPATTGVTKDPSSTRLDIYSVQLASTKAKIPLSVQINVTFSKELEDKRSEKYKNYSKEFQHKLLWAFATTHGLQAIEITGFRNGSIITLYDVILFSAAKDDLIESLKYINTSVRVQLQGMNITIDHMCVQVNTTSMSSELEKYMTTLSKSTVLVTSISETLNGCEILVDPCPFGYVCVANITGTFCQDKCYSKQTLCYNGGECYVDYKLEDLKCRCKDTDEYVYSGDRCEVVIRKVQSLSLSPKDYGIISGSAAGALVFILILYNLFKFLRTKRAGGKKENDQHHHKSDVNASEVSSQLIGKNTIENPAYLHAHGLPEINKDHRVYKDPLTGEEALIYQPTSINRPLSKEIREREYILPGKMSRRSVYDYIDTENPYKIMRPNVNESRNWPLL